MEKDNKNPDKWFADLEHIRLQLQLDFNYIIDYERMISQIIYNVLPNPYKTTIALIKRELNKKVVLTLNEVKDDIRQVYGTIKSGFTNKHVSALVSKSNFKKQFKGDCRICGKKGHKGSDCWTLDKNKNRSPDKFHKKGTSNEAANDSGTYKGPPCEYCKMTNH